MSRRISAPGKQGVSRYCSQSFFYCFLLNLPTQAGMKDTLNKNCHGKNSEVRQNQHNDFVLLWKATLENVYAWCWFLEVDLLEAAAPTQRASCYCFLSPSVRCRLYREGHDSGRLCHMDLMVMNPGCCAINSPVVWGMFDGIIFPELQGKRCA